MAGDGDGFEGPVADPDPVAVAHPLTGHVDPVVDRRDHRQCRPAAAQFVHAADVVAVVVGRSEEHTSELQSLMRISYAVFCLKKKKTPDRKPSTPRRKMLI